MSEKPAPRRSPGRIIIAVLYAILSLSALNEVVSMLRGTDDGPTALLVFQCLVSASGAATAWGAWKGARWSPLAASVYGFVAAAMLVSLGPLLDMPVEERGGLLTGAGMVLLFTLGCAWYLRRVTRHTRVEASKDLD